MISLLLFIILAVSFGEETIKYAAVIYRHGDRTPVKPYPTDPWRNESLWPVRFGQLTNTGKLQHYALGGWLRNRYLHVLSQPYDPVEIKVRSTDVDRTLMSAEVNLAGMFPPFGTSIWNRNLMWQPIPVHTMPENLDEVLSQMKPCKTYDMEKAKFFNSKDYKQRLSKYQGLIDFLTAYTGMTIKDYIDINEIYNTLYIENLYNLTLPEWTKTVFPEKLKEPGCYSFRIATATPLMARLKAGPLIKEIVRNMYSSVNNIEPNRLKLSIYSGHDFTISNVLNALGMFDGNCPEYTSTILFELVYDEMKKTHLVRISYRNTIEIVEPKVLYIPYCGKTCPLHRFATLYEKLIDVNFDADCNMPATSQLSYCYFVVLAIVAFMGYILYFSAIKNMDSRNRKFNRAMVRQAEQYLMDFRNGVNGRSEGDQMSNGTAIQEKVYMI